MDLTPGKLSWKEWYTLLIFLKKKKRIQQFSARWDQTEERVNFSFVRNRLKGMPYLDVHLRKTSHPFFLLIACLLLEMRCGYICQVNCELMDLLPQPLS